MAKYKLLTQRGYSITRFLSGEVYDEEYISINAVKVSSLIEEFPHDWELIKEQPMCTEKTIKLSLDQARKMYGKNPEMDELLLANFSKDEVTKKALPKSWKELNNVQGWKISAEGAVVRADVKDVSPVCRRGRFATEKQAKSALAMAQLSQLIVVYNDGWIPNWENDVQPKFAIIAEGGRILKYLYKSVHIFLAFKSAEIRDEFLKNFEPLIKEYFMID